MKVFKHSFPQLLLIFNLVLRQFQSLWQVFPLSLSVWASEDQLLLIRMASSSRAFRLSWNWELTRAEAVHPVERGVRVVKQMAWVGLMGTVRSRSRTESSIYDTFLASQNSDKMRLQISSLTPISDSCWRINCSLNICYWMPAICQGLFLALRMPGCTHDQLIPVSIINKMNV